MPYNYDDDSPFDERGILKDGRSVRMPSMLKDGYNRPPLVTDAAGGTAGLHRPGYRLAADDAAMRDAKAQAYEMYEQDLQNAWRGQDASKARPRLKAADHKMTMDEIYRQYEQELQQVWRRRP